MDRMEKNNSDTCHHDKSQEENVKVSLKPNLADELVIKRI